jgi:lipopolysaccharide/colanic/teichoic acid biosynthesis glycosyltransferase
MKPKMRERISEETSTRQSNVDERIVSREQIVVPRRESWLWTKRVADVVLACLLLVPAIPVIVLAGSFIKLTSRGPAFYWQTRVGLRGRTFKLCKLRTMVHNAEAITGPVWATDNDPRITRFGLFLRKTHIDELPQLISVLAGRMSLVGPRPERPEFVAKLEWEFPHYSDRLNVRPGITGLAQLRLPPDSTIENVGHKLKYDLHYVEHVGPWLDFRILAFTAVHFANGTVRMAWSSFMLPRFDEPTKAAHDEFGLRITSAHGGSME